MANVTVTTSRAFVTLNLAGSQTNIAEFRDGSNEIDFVDQRFQEHMSALSESEVDIFDTYDKVQKLDRFLSVERFSPLYNRNTEQYVSCPEKTQEEFRRDWRAQYDRLIANDTAKEEYFYEKAGCVYSDKGTFEDILNSMCLFDWCAVLVFRDVLREDFPKKTLAAFHDVMTQAFLSKPNVVARYLEENRPTAFFIQEFTFLAGAGEQEWMNEVTNVGYQLVFNDEKNTAFCIPSDAVYERVIVLPIPDRDTLFERETLAILIDDAISVTGKVLLVNTHLSSKNRKKAKGALKNHEDQLHDLMAFVHDARASTGDVLHPFMLGGDFNHFPGRAVEMGNVVEPPEDVATTNKCRTHAQPQRSKIGVFDTGSKDHFVTNLPFTIRSCEVQPGSGTLIPCPSHPFDHYFVKCEVGLG